MHLSRFEIQAGDVLDALRAAGFEAEVEQTGGGTATIRAVKDGTVLSGGPGYYDWAEPRNSIIHTGDFWVGPEENEDEEDAAVSVEAGCSAADITALFVKTLANERTP